MDTCICMHGVTWHFNSKKFKIISEIHKTLVDVMSCHQDDVVKKLACVTNGWTHTPHKPKKLTRRFVVPRGNNVKEICPRGNTKVVIYIFLYHDKCLLFMLELY